MIRRGKAVSAGLSIGNLLIKQKQCAAVETKMAENIDEELARLSSILCAGEEELERTYEAAKTKLDASSAEVFSAHLEILRDEFSVREPIEELIRGEGICAEAAIHRQFQEMEDLFDGLDNELMRERSADIKDIKHRLLRIARGEKAQDLSQLTENCILVAEELTPSDTVSMDTEHVVGIVTALGGETAHMAIIARTLGIPAIVQLPVWQETELEGKTAIIDGISGTLCIDPDEKELEMYRTQRTRLEEATRELSQYKTKPSMTADGVALELCANIGTPREAHTAAEYGADGIGLFRSEFLFMDREQLPSEEEQFLAYKEALEHMDGKPVIIRTLDIGGDKDLPILQLPKEENPFLGLRAIRLTLARKDMFLIQLRAILRASVYGDLRIMFPMISCLEELHEAKELLARAKAELDGAGIPTGAVKVGMMIEVPAAAILADVFAQEVEFFSIGTNDLIQYTIAAERGNEHVAKLYTPYHPAVLRLIANTAQAANRYGIPCGMCGEAAADLKLCRAFVGMGVTELSMSPRSILTIRKHLSEHTSQDNRLLAQTLLQGKSAEENEKAFA